MKLTILALLALGTAQAGGGQGVESIPEGRLVEFRTDPEAPAFGEVFDLHLTLRIGPGQMVFLPDTLIPTEAAESAAPGDWRAGPAAGDSIEIRARYPVIGYREALVELPWIELLFRAPGPEDVGADRIARSAAGLDPGVPDPADARRLLRIGGVDLGRYAPLDEGGLGAGPRPAADVLGARWSRTAILGGGLLALVGLGSFGILWRKGWGAVNGGRRRTRAGRSAREEALRELDRIRATGGHRNGRVDDFYVASSGVLRDYVGRTEPAWGPDLTSGEIIARLTERSAADSMRDLARTIEAAERVKFGRARPDPETAEGDWQVIRDWIRDAPEAG